MTFDGSRFPLRACGEDVTIYEWVRILDPEVISIGSHVIVDDFVLIQGGKGVEIGDHVHVSSFTSIVGGGSAVIGDHCSLPSGCRIVTGTDLADGSGLTNSTIPDKYRAVERGHVELGSHVLLGSNVVVHPGVTIGTGTVVGSGSVVTRDLPEWSICLGAPARIIRERPREEILRRAEALRADEEA
jgi:galactoside O-acetyltransferase